MAALDDLPVLTDEGQKRVAKALGSKWSLAIAKAARIAGEAQWTALLPDLAAAFDRILKRSKDPDKGCMALMAIARALYALDCDDAELYLRGMRHVQKEAIWGESVDTAAELRAICAMGLASTRYPEKLRQLVHLLVDSEWQARAGAARALAAVGSDAAALLLRLKVLTGDKEPEVMADCFTGLLSMDVDDAVPLVTSFADANDDEVREAAILALGASRKGEAIEWLKQQFAAVMDATMRKCILLSLATSRTDAAIEFVLGVIREGSRDASAMALSAMEVNRGDRRIAEEMERALSRRES